jgi:hypothetical protein
LKVGDPVLIDYYGSWWEGEVLALRKNGDVKVRYTDYDSSWDEVVPRSRLALDSTAEDDDPISVGEQVEVEWCGWWYQAEVLAREGAKYQIRYRGYGSDWDEAMTRRRIRRGSAKSRSNLVAAALHPPGPLRTGGPNNASAGKPVRATTALAAGDQVQIEQYGAWWTGEVLEVRPDGRVKVRYVGWGSDWDEVVPRSRLCLDAPGAWDELEGKHLRLHLDGGVILTGNIVERGEDYLLLKMAEGERVLVNKARLIYCELDVVP